LKKNNFLLLIFIAISFLGCNTIDTVNKNVNQGVLDISDWNFKQNGIITLNGQWEFYWNQLLEPTDFQGIKVKKYIELPGVWNSYFYDNEYLSGKGFATFRIRIKNKLKSEKLGLRVPFHFTAYKLWINNNLVAQNGNVGKTKETSIPQTVPRYVYFNAQNEDIILTLQVSNFHFDKGGVPAPYKFGLESQIKATQTRQFALDLFLIGSLFIMTVHHLGLYLLRRKEISTLYFSIICFLILLRSIGLGETILIVMYPNFNFEIYIKLILISAFTIPALFNAFLFELYPNESIRIVRKISIILGVIFSITLFFPATVSTITLVPVSIMAFCSISYALYVLVKALLHGREGAVYALMGMLILGITTINDLLFDNQIISSDYYIQYGIFFFIFSQSFLLSLKSSLAFLSIENLSIRINKINVASSRFVPTEFLSFLGKESVIDVNLGDHVIKDLTILFADIRSFTSISESMTPEENFEFINHFLKRISPIIRAHNGFIDKFIGDSIMALFPNTAKDAVLAASHLLKELDDYNTERIQAGLTPIKIGIGINSGSSMLGTIGEELRMDGTVISDAVNLASRLETLTKVYGTGVMVSDNVLNDVKEILPIDFRFLGNVQVKGKIHFVDIYDIFSFDTYHIRNLKYQTKEQFERAINLFQNKNIVEAKVIFESILQVFPEDRATQHYLQRIESEF
jgi:adenylate cyclase